MQYLGYHCNIEKKSFYKSIRREFENVDMGGNAFQIFVKTPRRKGLSTLTDRDAQSCKSFIDENNTYLVAHSVSIN